jgi:hypothetical protein
MTPLGDPDGGKHSPEHLRASLLREIGRERDARSVDIIVSDDIRRRRRTVV